MNKKETLQLMAVLKGAYPQFYREMTETEYQSTVTLWQSMFADDNAGVVAMAVKAHIASDDKGFPPVIGQIKKRIAQITEPQEMTEMEAWSLVKRAMSNSIYNAQSEFDNLPDDIQRVVGSPQMLKEWAVMDSDTVQSVIQSNFMRSFKVIQKNQKELKALPPDVKKYIAQITSGFKAIEG